MLGSNTPIPDYLTRAREVILPSEQAVSASPLPSPPTGDLCVGVDLGTAFLVLAVLDQDCQPLAGEFQFAQVARDGLVVDFFAAVEILKGMKQRIERRIGRELTHAATGYPPGVPQVEVRATAHVVEAAGMKCTGMIDEPTAANNLLGIQGGAIVDVGGGTTGIAVLEDGEVVYTADEPTGGTHFSLVIAGALGITFEEAESRKLDPSQQAGLFPLVRPVMEKVGSIITRHVGKFDPEGLLLVGGSSAFPGMERVIQEYTGIPAEVPRHPMLVTPLGIAMHNQIQEA